MTQIRISFSLCMLVFLGLMLVSCQKSFKLDKSALILQQQEGPLTIHGEKVKLNLEYELAPKAIPSKGIAVLRILQKDSTSTTEKAKEFIVGSKVSGIEGYRAGGQGSLRNQISFEEQIEGEPAYAQYWLEVSSLNATSKNLKKSKSFLSKSHSVAPPDLAYSFQTLLTEGPSKLSRQISLEVKPSFIPSDFIPDTVQPFEATIYFEVNKSVIRESERKRKEITQLADFLSKTKEILKIEVNGYASPDGELQFNNELANERATEAGKFVVNTLQKSEGLKSIQFNLKDANLYVQNKGTEDWKGLLRGIEFARIPNKDQVKDIITDPSLSSPEKQGKLKNMKESWEIISEDYLPPLRRANMIINTKVAPRSLEERLKLIRMQSPDISASEMLAATEQIDEVSQKIEILELIKKQYPADHRSYNNLAVYDIQQNRMETAAKTLDAAAEADPKSKEVLSNQALVAYKQKNWSKLESVVGRAKKAGHSLPDYEAVLAIRAGKYTLAVQTLGDRDTDYLLALAHCLNRNYQAASQSLKGLGSTTAPVAYLKAVIGARTQNTSAVESELQKLVLLDASAAGRLNKDPEFAAYRQEGFFKKLQP